MRREHPAIDVDWTSESVVLLVLLTLALFHDLDDKNLECRGTYPSPHSLSRSGCVAADKARSGAGNGGSPHSLDVFDGRRPKATRHLTGRGLRHGRAPNLPVRLVKAHMEY